MSGYAPGYIPTCISFSISYVGSPIFLTILPCVCTCTYTVSMPKLDHTRPHNTMHFTSIHVHVCRYHTSTVTTCMQEIHRYAHTHMHAREHTHTHTHTGVCVLISCLISIHLWVENRWVDTTTIDFVLELHYTELLLATKHNSASQYFGAINSWSWRKRYLHCYMYVKHVV